MRVSKHNPRWSDEEFVIVRSLAEANIGRRFLDFRLNQFGSQGELLSQHFEPEILAERLMAGRCVVLQGESRQSHDLFMTYMKAFVLSGYTAIVNPVEEYFPDNSLYAPGEFKEPFDAEKDVIGLVNFWDASVRENPLSPKERRIVELHITSRLDDNVSMVFSGTGALSTCDWWTPTLRSRILENAEVISL